LALREDWIFGWDIGGAHLKVALADTQGRLHRCEQYYTPLWRGLEYLDAALDQVAVGLPIEHGAHRMTMTGELVDLFEDHTQGVARLCARLAERLPTGRVRIYAGPEGFVTPDRAGTRVRAIASANWHATATLVAEALAYGLLVDIGSTTTDLVPLMGGRVCARGYSDRERLEIQELVYTGVVRTPIMSLVQRVPLAGAWTQLAAEQFATTADIYRLTGELPLHADLGETADGRGKGEAESAVRLARMIGEDALEQEPEIWRGLARYLRDCQLERIGQACARHGSLGLPLDAPLVGAGVGRFLVSRLAQRLERPYVDISTLLGANSTPEGLDPADCAPAAAVALLGLGATDATID
jgi:(4-(4-[2-(gamma-L-glutamylamino)ethyl]phenoxymethyl)furan-2-yl)methanamine synthase